MLYLIVYFVGLILILLMNNILDEFDIDIIFNNYKAEDITLRTIAIIFWPLSIPCFIVVSIVVILYGMTVSITVKLIRKIIYMKFTFNLKEISQSIRKSFAHKEKVIKSKKKYNRKNKNWKKEI